MHLCSIDGDAAQRFGNVSQRMDVLNGLDWTAHPLLSASLEESVHNSPGLGICYRSNVSIHACVCVSSDVVKQHVIRICT